jgi:diamine N-acetyltransferase
LTIGLRYVFDELNLYRVNVVIAEYAASSIRRVIRLGFKQEVRRREVIFARGRYWDQLRFGLLESEWRLPVKE